MTFCHKTGLETKKPAQLRQVFIDNSWFLIIIYFNIY